MQTFDIISGGDLSLLSENDDVELYLPFLTRVYTNSLPANKTKLIKILQKHKQTATCIQYQQRIDWDQITESTRNEIKFREKLQKSFDNPNDFREGSLIASLGDSILREFETGTFEKRARLVLSELACLVDFAKHRNEFFSEVFDSPLFSNEIYVEEINFIIAVAITRTDDLFTIHNLLLALSFVEHYESHMTSMVANNPSLLEEVIQILVENCKKKNSEKFYKILHNLSNLSKLSAIRIRDECTKQSKLPNLCLSTTIHQIHDVIEFMSSLLNVSNGFIWRFMNQNPNMELIEELKNNICHQLQSQKGAVEICSILRLCCGMLGYAGIFVCENKNHYDLFINLCLNGPKSTRMARLIICYLMIIASNKPQDQLCRESLGTIVKILRQANRCKDIILLLATYSHAKLFKKIAEFLKSTSYLPDLELNIEGFQNISTLFTDELIPLDVLAKEILTISPRTVKKGEDWFVLQCVYNMLKSNLFRNHNVDASEWVYEQIKCCVDSEPLPESIPKIVTSLVSNSTPHPNFPFNMNLFSSEKILQILKDSRNLTPHALILLYVLSVKKKNHKVYGSDILEQCDVILIVNFLKKNRDRLSSLYSHLLSLIVEQLQHLFHLNILLKNTKRWNVEPSNKINDLNFVKKILKDPLENQPVTKIVLDELCSMKANKIRKLQDDIIGILPNLLNEKFENLFIRITKNFQNRTERYLLNSFKNLWEYMCTSTPMSLCLKTVNVLHKTKFKHEDIYKNVLVLFDIDKRTFFLPPLMSIFLQILGSYMIASKNYLNSLISSETQQSTIDTLNTYKVTQESTVIQSLLDLCANDTKKEISEIRIIRRMICNFIHQKFIENPFLAKLVHFQTYPINLLEITVEGIESIHICMGFLKDLLSHPHLEKRVFGIALVSHLCKKYPIQISTDNAKYAIKKAKELGITGSGSTSETNRNAAMTVIEPLIRIAQAFPFLAMDVLAVLYEIKSNFKSDVEMNLFIDEKVKGILDERVDVNRIEYS